MVLRKGSDISVHWTHLPLSDHPAEVRHHCVSLPVRHPWQTHQIDRKVRLSQVIEQGTDALDMNILRVTKNNYVV